jgi:hypothetical protein
LNKLFFDKNDLIKLGFKKHQAQGLIQQTKIIMVKEGFEMYNNKRIGIVPKGKLEQVLGVRLKDDDDEN